MTLRRSVRQTAGFAALYLVAAYAGRLTVMDQTNLSLVWPAAGVLAVWFAAQWTSRWRWLDVLALAVITMMVNLATGTSAGLAAVFVVANLLQGVVFVKLVRRWLPGLWTGDQVLTQLSELWRLISAATVSSLCGAVAAPAGMWLLTGHFSATAVAVWLARSTVSVLLIGVAARRIGHLLRHRVPFGAVPRARKAEYAAVVVASFAAYVFAFGYLEGLPVAFLLISTTVWAGLRTHTTFVILHDLCFGAVAVIYTLAGRGPFAQIESNPSRALVAQLFVGTVAVIGLALALGRDERANLITELRTSERAATDQAGLLTAIVHAMSEGVAVIGEDGRFLLRNPAGAALLGGVTSPTGRMERTSFYGLTHVDGTSIAEEDLPHRQAFTRDHVEPVDFLVRNDGVPEGRILRFAASRLPYEIDGLRHAVVVYHDVTADRRHRDELAAFAGVVAHDLLSPLATIEGWTDELQEQLAQTDPGTAGSLARIQRAAARQRALISGLLSYTTARSAQLHPAVVDLDDLVADIAAGRHDQAESTGAPVPLFRLGVLGAVTADPVLTRQLLDNLIGNAIKYTAAEVVPQLTVTRTPEADGLARITIDDNGIGIPDGQHDAVFQNFHRAHPGAGHAGTGLGLAICKRIVERHGGTIAAAANPAGAGTRVTFTLPAAPDRVASRGGVLARAGGSVPP
jgi:signal transduction histidine kinase